jgi:TetR/AcrR family transcriptional regulator, regulator of cefoperazone and chloramphenicol sensitivity
MSDAPALVTQNIIEVSLPSAGQGSGVSGSAELAISAAYVRAASVARPALRLRDLLMSAAEDPSPYTRIRSAALAGFARNGVAATSIRDVAVTAGVSPGLVQHYFASKAALREAVDEYALEVLRSTLVLREGETALAEISEQLTRLMAEHHLVLLYMARGVAEQDEAAMAIFDAMVEIARTQLTVLQGQGQLREDLDLKWAALHTVLINLGAAILEPGVTRQLGMSFLSPKAMARWRTTTTALFVRGEFAGGPRKEP